MRAIHHEDGDEDGDDDNEMENNIIVDDYHTPDDRDEQMINDNDHNNDGHEENTSDGLVNMTRTTNPHDQTCKQWKTRKKLKRVLEITCKFPNCVIVRYPHQRAIFPEH